jgi:hypothetical protein
VTLFSHPPHPSHPTTMYDYVDSNTIPIQLIASHPIVPRAALLPSTPAHISPQPSARDYIRSRAPSISSGVSSLPSRRMRETIPPVTSPPLIHAADYPLETPSHGVDPSLTHLECAEHGEHEHNFELSRQLVE